MLAVILNYYYGSVIFLPVHFDLTVKCFKFKC